MEYLLYITMLLLLGTIFTFIAAKLKVSNIFFLILAGLLLGMLNLLEVPLEFLEVVSTIALALVVFDSVATFKLSEAKGYAFKFVGVFFTLNLLLMAAATFLLLGYFSIPISMIAALIFSALMFGVDETVTLSVLDHIGKVTRLLEIEAVVNSPLTIIVPLLLVKVMEGGVNVIGAEVLTFFLGILVPILMGAVIGYFAVFFMKFDFFEEMSYLLVISGSILSYVANDALGYSGIFAVVAFAIVFGKSNIVDKKKIEQQAIVIGHILIIFVFLLLGSLIAAESRSRTSVELLAGTILFIIYLAIRYLSVELSFGKEFKFKEKMFMTLSAPKGVDVAVVILLLITTYSGIEGLSIVKNLSLLFVLYSVVVATVVAAMGNFFLR